MCGRFRLEQEDYEDLKDLVDSVDKSLDDLDYSKDQTPGGPRAILRIDDHNKMLQAMTWGYPSFDGKLLVNARSETVLEKPSFRQGFLRRRLLIPMSSFYEYSSKKEATLFYRPGELSYVAGFYDSFEGRDHFILLTRPAKEPVSQIHHRMPLIIEQKDVNGYLEKGTDLEKFLQDGPSSLEIKRGTYQLDFFS